MPPARLRRGGLFPAGSSAETPQTLCPSGWAIPRSREGGNFTANRGFLRTVGTSCARKACGSPFARRRTTKGGAMAIYHAEPRNGGKTLHPEDLDEFEKILKRRKAFLADDILGLNRDWSDKSEGDAAHSHHMADSGTDSLQE